MGNIENELKFVNIVRREAAQCVTIPTINKFMKFAVVDAVKHIVQMVGMAK